jgi:hypothetical protein
MRYQNLSDTQTHLTNAQNADILEGFSSHRLVRDQEMADTNLER